jgi:hypothetical protein
MPGILAAVGAGEIKISSLHNFCPLPMGVTHAAPNLYEFSADKDYERDRPFVIRSRRLISPGSSRRRRWSCISAAWN